MKRTFEISYPNELDPEWLNEDNVFACLCEGLRTGNRGIQLEVRDVAEDVKPKKPQCSLLACEKEAVFHVRSAGPTANRRVTACEEHLWLLIPDEGEAMVEVISD